MRASRSTPVFDTYKAVEALRHAGFDDVQARAVAEQINVAANRNVPTSTDLDRLGTKQDFERLLTKEDLNGFELRVNTRLDQLNETLRWSLLGMAISFVALTKVLDVVVG